MTQRMRRLFLLLLPVLFLYGQPAAADDLSPDKLKEIRTSAEKGDAKSQYKIATMYAGGWNGLQQDGVEATRWLTLSAEQGYVPAERLLGMMYSEHDDKAKALYWLKKAADRGDERSRQRLEEAMARSVESLDSLTRKAEAGDVEAQYALAGRYNDGRDGAPRNREESIKWARKAADQGYAPAIDALKTLK
jgi:TPR repeat protein